MAEKILTRLVGRIAQVVESIPFTEAMGQNSLSLKNEPANLTASDRRARLALRIALLRHGLNAAIADQPDAAKSPAESMADPIPEPVVVPQAPPPPTAKPARVMMSTLRLEDAAMLLAAAAAPAEPPFVPAALVPKKAVLPDPALAATPSIEDAFVAEAVTEPSTPKPQRRKGETRNWMASPDDMGNAFASLAALGADATAPATDADGAATASAQPALPEAPAASKGKRRSGSVSAADGLAGAASAFAALEMADPDDTEKAAQPSATETAMLAGLAALRGAG